MRFCGYWASLRWGSKQYLCGEKGAVIQGAALNSFLLPKLSSFPQIHSQIPLMPPAHRRNAEKDGKSWSQTPGKPWKPHLSFSWLKYQMLEEGGMDILHWWEGKAFGPERWIQWDWPFAPQTFNSDNTSQSRGLVCQSWQSMQLPNYSEEATPSLFICVNSQQM